MKAGRVSRGKGSSMCGLCGVDGVLVDETWGGGGCTSHLHVSIVGILTFKSNFR